MLYFDTSYIVRLYTMDQGWEKVRALARSNHLACCLHGRAETIAAFHRKYRENVITQNELGILVSEFERDCNVGAFRWLPISPELTARISAVYKTLPAEVALRAADAIHLGCAALAGCDRIYSNDSRLLASATYFGLRGENII